jgi:hypothetical protein
MAVSCLKIHWNSKKLCSLSKYSLLLRRD